MLCGVLFEKEGLVHAARITLKRERLVFEVRDEDRRDASVIIDYLAFRESGGGVKNFFQVGELEGLASNFDDLIGAQVGSSNTTCSMLIS